MTLPKGEESLPGLLRAFSCDEKGAVTKGTFETRTATYCAQVRIARDAVDRRRWAQERPSSRQTAKRGRSTAPAASRREFETCSSSSFFERSIGRPVRPDSDRRPASARAGPGVSAPASVLGVTRVLGGDWPSVAMDVTMTADPPDKGGGAFVAFKELQTLQAKQRAARSAAPASPGTSPGGSRVRLSPRLPRLRERRRHERARGPARALTESLFSRAASSPRARGFFRGPGRSPPLTPPRADPSCPPPLPPSSSNPQRRSSPARACT